MGLSEVEEVKYCPGVECRGKFGKDESSWVIGGAKSSEFCSTCAKIWEFLIFLPIFFFVCVWGVEDKMSESD